MAGAPAPAPAARVLVVGASFAGLACVRALRAAAGAGAVEVTVVDKRDFFEYAPGILRLFVQPKAFPSLTARLTPRALLVRPCRPPHHPLAPALPLAPSEAAWTRWLLFPPPARF